MKCTNCDYKLRLNKNVWNLKKKISIKIVQTFGDQK